MPCSLAEQALSNLAQGIFFVDTKARFTFINPAACGMLGITEEQDVLGHNCHDLIHHGCCDSHFSLESRDCPMLRVLEQGQQTVAHEDRLWRQDGTVIDVLLHAAALRDESQSLVGAVVSFHDISERKKAERERAARASELSEQEALYRDLVENHPHLVGRYHPDTTMIFANQSAAEFFGFTVEEFIGERWLDLLPDNERAIAQRYLDRFTPQEPVHSVELAQVNKDGETCWISWTNKAYFCDNGELNYFQAVGIDVTQQRKAEQALRESEQLFREMAENIDEVFWMRTADRMLYLNPAFERQTGISVASTYAEPNNFIDNIHPEGREQIAAKIYASAAGGADFDEIFKFVRPDNGQIRWFHARCSPIYDGNGEVDKSVGVARDVTSLIELRERLHHALQAKSFFLNAVSHDLRAPLNTILGLVEQIDGIELTPQQRHYLQLCRSAGKRAQGLIDTLLVMGRSEAGYVEIQTEELELRPFINEQMEMLGIQASEKGLRLDYHVGVEVPEVVRFDPLRLGQVLFNLVINAIKFTEKGYVQVRISQSAAQYVMFEVEDTGPGISPENQQRLFQAFEQLSLNGVDQPGRKQGFGLGLAISRELVRQMGGELYLRSELGKGTTFFFVLQLPCPEPMGGDGSWFDQGLVENSEVYAANDSHRGEQGDGEPLGDCTENADALPGKGLQVLVVEDEAINSILMRRIVEQHGALTTAAFDGAQALRLWQSPGADLVLMDIELPMLNGPQVVAAIRREEQDKQLPRTPIVMMSSHSSGYSRSRCQDLDIDACLSKPVYNSRMREILAWVSGYSDGERHA